MLPFDHLAIDLKQMPPSKRGNAYYLLVIDVATRFLFLRPLASKSSYSVAQQLLRLFCDVGFPKILQSDNGGEFVNSVMAALKQLSGIDERLISAYHHRANGMAERAIQSTSHSIYKVVGGLISQWDDYLPAIQHAFNTRVVELHGSSPYALLYGRAPNAFADYRDSESALEDPSDRKNRLLFLNSVVFPAIYEKVGRVNSKRQENFARTHRMLKEDYPAGSQVMVKDEMVTAKHQPRYEGPFTVMRRKESGNYELKGLDGTLYTRSPWVLKQVSPEILKDLDVSDTLYAAVDHIVEHRDLPDGSSQYRVRWEKQGPELDSWLFEKDFIDYGPLQKYSKAQGIDVRTKKVLPNSGTVRAAVSVTAGSNPFPKRSLVNGKAATERKVVPRKVTFKLKEPVADLVRPEVVGVTQVNASPTPIDIYLDEQQKRALGDYWKSTISARRPRNQPIVESDSDKE